MVGYTNPKCSMINPFLMCGIINPVLRCGIINHLLTCGIINPVLTCSILYTVLTWLGQMEPASSNNPLSEGATSWMGRVGPPDNLNEVHVEPPTDPAPAADVSNFLDILQTQLR
ncbi:hypothetical protein C8J56DRAFT_898833 [Mycena floridula]|nr:hypothetical protein C8J56DRAFT_898833 [Mycena floridula]